MCLGLPALNVFITHSEGHLWLVCTLSAFLRNGNSLSQNFSFPPCQNLERWSMKSASSKPGTFSLPPRELLNGDRSTAVTVNRMRRLSQIIAPSGLESKARVSPKKGFPPANCDMETLLEFPAFEAKWPLRGVCRFTLDLGKGVPTVACSGLGWRGGG